MAFRVGCVRVVVALVVGGLNPDHVFEIHPLTDFRGTDLKSGFHGSAGYKYKDAADSFFRYERTPAKLTRSAQTTKIETKLGGTRRSAESLDGPGPGGKDTSPDVGRIRIQARQ